ncbi:glycosyltransferase family 2 protein [Primorskyibacter sp. S187A]|uniref:glycosyltransferase family 2 protein n=1 Tax=Primorskyibacter sp. S187A TaxID=3415130 RepID=UPI003C7DE7BE
MTQTASSDPILSIIIISYNTRQMTLDCLASVYKETTTPFELIVVDNASSDGSAEAIAAAFPPQTHPNLTLLAETENHGFAPGHEVALPHARAPWLLLLNPDTLVLEGAIDKLMAFAARTPDAGIWGGRTIFGDGTLNPASCWGRMTPWSTLSRILGLSGIFPRSEIFNSETYGRWPRDTERDVDIVSGCFFLMRRADWDALDGFDPAFVMYGEEADLCLRAKKRGFQPRVCPEATIVHYGGASETVRADKVVRLMKAKIELIKRHFPPGLRRFGCWLFSQWPRSRHIATGLAARLLRNPRLAEKSAVWGEAWARRGEWRDGFSGP